MSLSAERAIVKENKALKKQLENAQAALDELDIEIVINHQHNQNTVMGWWSQDRQNMAQH